MESIMAYETETTQNIPIAERISKAAGSAAQAIGDYADFREQQKKTQAYVDELQQRQKFYAQQYQENQVKMRDQSLQSQTGLLFTAASSEDPSSAMKMLYPRYSNFSQFTGDQSDPN